MTPTGHTYTKADFERMRFDRDFAADALNWNSDHKISGLNDEGRAALQEMIDQYDALHESEEAT